MADFNTHVFAAAAAASLSATICTKLLNLPVSTALLLSFGGTIGGVLPDIDLKHSVPSKILFSVFGAIAAITWMFARLGDFSVVELWVFAIVIFVTIRFPLWALFHQFTVHRGSLHSLAAAMMFGMLSAVVGEHVLNIASQTSWLLAGFVVTGVLIHLLLDEIYSVDFIGARIKRSFGSALKIIDMERVAASCLILFVCLVSWFWTPPADEFFNLWRNNDINWRDLLLPGYLQVRR